MNFYVDVPADLDQLGRDNSHGTVIGGEGLVELRHNPTNGRLFLNQVHEISSIGKIQGGLHTGDATTDHHYGSYLLAFESFICHKSSTSKDYLHLIITMVCEYFNNLRRISVMLKSS
jgi:hypothetical protein